MPDTPCTLADLVVRCLEAEGVECVFGIPGEENIRLGRRRIARRSASSSCATRGPLRFLADVYGRLTGKAGVCPATLGPGALNLILGVADATTDSTPLVAITAQVGLDRIYKESHQSVDHSEESAVRHAVVAPSGCTGAPTPRGTGVTVSAQPTALGTILVDAHGRTVYEVANDTASASTRTPACGSNWPLVAALASLPGAPFRRRSPAHRRWPRHFPSQGCLHIRPCSSTELVMSVPRNQIGHVWLNFGDVASQTQKSQYIAFIGSLRRAVGYEFRNGVFATQNAGNELVRVDLTSPDGQTIWLWITPNNLYVRGVTAANGVTYTFNDGDYFLSNAMNTLGNNGLLPAGPLRGFGTLQFGSNYDSLRQAAGRGPETMPISIDDLIGSVNQLAALTGVVNQQATARSLMFLIQFTSEAARFTDVEGVFQNVMGNRGASYHGLPALQQEIENSWDQISRYAHAVTQNSSDSTKPLDVPGVQIFNNFGDVQRRLGILMGQTSFVNPTGDWRHTEL